MRSRFGSSFLAVVSAIAAITAIGCDKETTKPPPVTALASIATIWPNEEGRRWIHAITNEEWRDTSSVGVFDSIAAVPPAPSLATIDAYLGTVPPGDMASSDSGSYTLWFTGMTTTKSGVTAQNLVESIGFPTALRAERAALSRRSVGSSRAFPGRMASANATTRIDPLFVLLARARPDLEPALRRRLGVSSLAVTVGPPLFIHGGAWRKTANAIIGYGDVDTFPAWKYLQADIVPGAEFTHQLVPSLASNVYLHCRVVGRKSVTTPLGTYANAIECQYLVDYGVTAITDETGGITGYERMISYGKVAYADTVGPIACSERHLLRVGANGTFSNGAGANHVSLVYTDQARSATAARVR